MSYIPQMIKSARKDFIEFGCYNENSKRRDACKTRNKDDYIGGMNQHLYDSSSNESTKAEKNAKVLTI